MKNSASAPKNAVSATPRVLQIQLGLAGNPARIAIVVLPCDRIDHVAVITSVLVSVNGSMNAVVRIRDEQHVALIDGRPSADAGPVDAEPFLERLLVQFGDGIRNVLLQAGQVGETQVELPRFFLLR